jgi:hypothetical protein
MFAKLILPGGFFHPAKTIFAGTVFSTNRQKLANPAYGKYFTITRSYLLDGVPIADFADLPAQSTGDI